MIIRNAHVFRDGRFQDLDVEYDGNGIRRLVRGLTGGAAIDAAGRYLYAGFIDCHIHGAFGHSFCKGNYGNYAQASEHDLRDLLAQLPRYGVTSCMPTICGTTADQRLAAGMLRHIRRDVVGCDPFQLHYEGPYLSPRQLNALATTPWMRRDPSIQDTLDMCDGDLSDVALISIAPELPGAIEWIRWCTAQGVKTEIGYTQADSATVRAAADAGLTQTTHFYNGFRPMHHRLNGPQTACLLDDRISCQMTLDNFHVASDWVQIAIRLKGLKRIYGLTDMVALSGLPEGEHEIAGYGKVRIDGERITSFDGTILGANIVFNQMMRCARDRVGLSMEQVGSIFTENPADCLSIADRGRIEPGRRSDLVIMDRDYRVLTTIIKGQVYYQA